jgi:hypothetical protein
MTVDLVWALAWYGALAAGLLLSVLLFVGVKLDMRRLERTLKAENAEWQRRVGALEAQIAGVLEREAAAAAAMAASAAAATPAAPALNVSRRSQALRLHRTGQSAEQIAQTLAIPANEVRLLLKVHQLVLDRFQV